MDRGFDHLVSTLRKRENYKKGTHDENNNITVVTLTYDGTLLFIYFFTLPIPSLSGLLK